MWQVFKRWFHQWGSPRWFYQRSMSWSRFFAWAALLLLSSGLVWGLLFAPPDYQQGNSFRIIYFHVPAAMLAQSCYLFMALAGVVTLVWRMKITDMLMKSAAPIGASFCFLALFSGAVWGKPTWGTWWVWDARLTSMLILLFLYLGAMALQSAIQDRVMAGRATAVLVLVGAVNIPIIKYSVDWWNTLHQPATFTLTEKPSMPVEMWAPLLLVTLGVYALFAYCLLLRTRNEILEREKRTQWVRRLVVEG